MPEQQQFKLNVVLIQVLAAKPWSMADERTGQLRTGTSYRADVAMPGLGSFKVKLTPEQHASLSAQPFGTPLLLNLVPRVGQNDQVVFDVASAELVAADPGRKAS